VVSMKTNLHAIVRLVMAANNMRLLRRQTYSLLFCFIGRNLVHVVNEIVTLTPISTSKS
jgi:hypothetical protein